MKKTSEKGIIAAVAAAAVILVFSFGAYAQGGPHFNAQPGHRGAAVDATGVPGPPPALTPEQAETSRKLFAEHFEKTRPVRQNLRDQQLVYDALAGNPNAKPEDIKAVVAEMRKLRDRLHELRLEFKAEYEKSGLPAFAKGAHLGDPGPHWGNDGCGFFGGDKGGRRGHKGRDGYYDDGRHRGGHGRGDRQGYGHSWDR
ncbi:MAG: periplasmic heavy metal sensor [Deltaproteobacteria bacterium]|jgi:Spy/CpxP family protein refolding chaperone|nr:periplasmic heavy metal sensor [Deltaproteobacteria bacterium]